MKVLMLSTDRDILKEGSPTQKRMELISDAVERLHILVLGSEAKSIKNISEKLIIQGVPSLSKIFIPLRAYQAARKIVKRGWIVTSQDEFIGIAGYLLKRVNGIPWEAQVHTDIASPEYRKFSLQNRARAFIARHTYVYATRVRAVSERVKQNLLQWKHFFVVPIDILPVFIDTSKFYKNTNRSDNVFRVISVSRLSPEKRIDGVIRAFATLHQKYTDTELVIVGDGVEREYLENLVKELEIVDATVFAGSVDNVEDYYARADLYVLNSAYESYGRTIVEAMAVGLPVLSTDVGIVREFTEESTAVNIIKDNDDLSVRLQEYFQKRDYLSETGERGRQFVLELFSDDEYKESLRSNWSKLV